MNYQKIAVIGISGSGKSTFSRELADITQLSLFYMDQLFWKGNWEAIPEAEYLRTHEELIQKSNWIIEGYIDAKMSSRLKEADLVIYLDYSGIRCAWRVIKRWFNHRKQSRPELPEEAHEKFKWDFLWMVLNRGERDDIETAIKKENPSNLYRFNSPGQLEKFIKEKLT